jgi:hypothetical protein
MPLAIVGDTMLGRGVAETLPTVSPASLVRVGPEYGENPATMPAQSTSCLVDQGNNHCVPFLAYSGPIRI